MNDIERFIVDNLQLLLIIAFIVLPIIFNRKKLKKSKPRKAQGADTAREKKQLEGSLETKVRKFFEELVVEKSPDVSKSPPPVSEAMPLGREDRAEMGQGMEQRMEMGEGLEQRAEMGHGMEQRAEMGMGMEDALEAGRRPRPARQVMPEHEPVDADVVGWKKVVKKSPPRPKVPASPGVPVPQGGTIETAADPHFYKTIPSEEGRDAIMGSDLTDAVPISRVTSTGRSRFNAAALRAITGGSIRNAIIIKEILDKPVTLRD
jgi:hypothetical protein